MLIIAILGMLFALIITGRNQLAFNAGFFSILLLGAVLFIWLMNLKIMPFIKKACASYRKEHLSGKNQ